jgi:hypothetical protein
MNDLIDNSLVEQPEVIEGYPNENWVLSGCLSVDGDNSFVRHSREFKGMMDKIGLATDLPDSAFHYVSHVLADDECLNGDGEVVPGQMKLYFLISNKIGPYASRTRVTAESLYYLIHALWPFKIHDIRGFDHELDNGLEALKITGDDELYVPPSKLTISTGLRCHVLHKNAQKKSKE